MLKHITIRWPALCAGILATAGALLILLQDARPGALKLEHILIPIVLAIQILVTHSISPAVRSRRWDSAAGFFLLAVITTYALLFMSISKQSDVAEERRARYDLITSERAKLEPLLMANQTMLEAERKLLARECASGKGTKCEGKKATVQVYEDAVTGVQAKIDALGPVPKTNSGPAALAEIVSVLIGGDKAKIEHAIVITWPITLALICEGVALVSFGFAIVHNRQRSPANDTAPATFAGNDGPAPNGGGKRSGKRPLPANVVSFADHPVRLALKNVDGPVSNNELASLMGVCPGEASKRWREIEPDLHVTRAGRELRIALRKG
jgi:hypothetical protein